MKANLRRKKRNPVPAGIGGTRRAGNIHSYGEARGDLPPQPLEAAPPEPTESIAAEPPKTARPSLPSRAATKPAPIPESPAPTPEDFDFVSDPKNKPAAIPRVDPSKAPAKPDLSAPFSKKPAKTTPAPKPSKPSPRGERQPIPRQFILIALGIAAAIVVVALVFKFYFYPSHGSEGVQNLIALQEREKQFYAANHRYAKTFAELGWRPAGVRYYAYFMSPAEVVQPGWTKYSLPQGITASVSDTNYTFVAVGNLDMDPDLDVWAIQPDSKPKHLRKD